MSNLSINQLFQSLSGLDSTNQFRFVSYNLTTKNTLSNAPLAPWWTFIPYGNWANAQNNTPPSPSPFETGIRDVIKAAFAQRSANYFIDLLHLSGGNNATLFDDAPNNESIITILANVINKLPTDTNVIIRYLEGDSPGNINPSPAQNAVVRSFFPDNSPFTKKNVAFYFGGYNPDINFTDKGPAAQLVRRFIKWLFTRIEKEYPQLHVLIEKFEQLIADYIIKILSAGQPLIPLSWNHAKMVAINGRNIIAAGANFWQEYTTGSEGPFDMAMSITGDAAADGQLYANHLWEYLAARPSSDTNSFCKVNMLGQPITAFSDTTKPALFLSTIPNTGNTGVLSVARNGNWPANDLDYPLQIIDAIRDFATNMLAVIIETHFDKRTDFTVWITWMLSDEHPDMQYFLRSEGLSAAAWASRYARNYTITRATKSVKLSQQKLVLNDICTGKYMDFVHEFNKDTLCNWNGYIWPFDLLMALGYALSTISHNNAADNLVGLVSSVYEANSMGYQDPVSSDDFKEKLIGIMNAMQYLKYIRPNGHISDIVNDLFVYKRIPADSGNGMGNHSKLLIVDDSVGYVGSDNAYPCYNSEFGFWIDDQVSLKNFLDNYWANLWKYATTNEQAPTPA